MSLSEGTEMAMERFGLPVSDEAEDAIVGATKIARVP